MKKLTLMSKTLALIFLLLPTLGHAYLYWTIGFGGKTHEFSAPADACSAWGGYIEGTHRCQEPFNCKGLNTELLQVSPSVTNANCSIERTRTVVVSNSGGQETTEQPASTVRRRTTQKGIDCPPGSTENSSNSACYYCPPPLTLTDNQGSCEIICPQGQSFDANANACVVDEQNCDSGHSDATTVGQPIDFLSGYKFHTVSLYQGSGAYPLAFAFTYNSQNGEQLGSCSLNRNPNYLGATAGTGLHLGSAGASGNGPGINPDAFNQSYTPGQRYTSSSARQTLYRSNDTSTQTAFWNVYTPSEEERAICKAHVDLTWKHTYQRTLIVNDNKGLIYHRANGRRERFSYNTSRGVYESTNSRYGEVRSNANGFELTRRGASTEYFDTKGRLIRITNVDGLSHYVDYNTTDPQQPNQIVGIRDDFGRTLTLGYTAAGVLNQLTDPDGHVYQIETGVNTLTSITFPDGQKERYEYEGNNLKRVYDSTDRIKREYYYNNVGKAIYTSINGNINRYVVIYGDNETRVINPLGKSTVYKYGQVDNRKRILETEGVATQRCVASNSTTNYDANGFKNQVVEKNGSTTDYDYNSRGLNVRTTYAVGTPQQRLETTDWHATLPLPLKETVPGRETRYTYDGQGRMLTRTVKDTATNEARTSTYAYNARGLVVSLNGPRTDVNDTTLYEYDAQGNLTKTTNALSHTRLYSNHNASGNPQTLTDENGVITRVVYDSRQRPTRVTRAADTAESSQITLQYDLEGNLVQTTLADNSFLKYEYDVANRLTAVQDTLGNRIEYTLDAAGNQTTVNIKDPAGTLTQTYSTVFDELSRVYTAVGAAQQEDQFRYDAAGNPISAQDALNRRTTHEFDALNRLNGVVDANNGRVAFTYNDRDELTSVTDQRGLVTTYTYNGFGDTLTTVSPDTGTTAYEYDTAGNMTRMTDARGVDIRHTYDALNRLTGTSYSTDSQYNTTLTWDQGSNGIGKLSRVEDGFSARTYTYDRRGNVLNDSLIINGQTYTTGYTYDTADKLTQITHANGLAVDVTYNTNRQPTNLNQRVNNQTTSLVQNMTWQPFGGINRLVYGNALVYTQSYDLDGRPQRIQTPSTQKDYAYDPVSNITGISRTDTLAGRAASQTFGYDVLDRLTQESGHYGTRSYEYDGVGNRTKRTRVQATDSGNQTTVDTTTPGTTRNRLAQRNQQVYTFDNAGNLTQDWVHTANGPVARTLQYDPQGRLQGITQGNDLRVQYNYNAFNQRVRKTLFEVRTCPQDEASGTTPQCEQVTPPVSSVWIYLYDQSGKHLTDVHTNAQGTTLSTVHYHWVNDMPVAQTTVSYNAQGGITNTETLYLHTDHLMTPRQATNASQTVVWDWESDAFGDGIQRTDPDNNGTHQTVHLRFPGQYHDTESGLYYNWNRYYDPRQGRYVTSDPIGLNGGINTYGYVHGNPLSLYDPRGLSAAAADYFEIFQDAFVDRATSAAASRAMTINPVTMAIGGVLFPTEMGNAGMSERQAQKEARRIEREIYKAFCKGKPPKTGDRCTDLKNEIEYHRTCSDMKEKWDKNWPVAKYPKGRHADEIEKRRARADKLQNIYDEECKNACD